MNVNAFPDYPVIDGFLLNTKLRCNLTMYALATREWETLRRSGAYKSKTWCIPEDSTIVIPARDTFESQVKCVPGSAIWAFIFTAPRDTGPFSVNVRDSCTDQYLISEAVRCNGFQHTFGASPRYRQQPLSRLLVVSAPGLVHVEISSQQATDQTQVQLILCGGEPVC
jgi:hypothetical protein